MELYKNYSHCASNGDKFSTILIGVWLTNLSNSVINKGSVHHVTNICTRPRPLSKPRGKGMRGHQWAGPHHDRPCSGAGCDCCSRTQRSRRSFLRPAHSAGSSSAFAAASRWSALAFGSSWATLPSWWPCARVSWSIRLWFPGVTTWCWFLMERRRGDVVSSFGFFMLEAAIVAKLQSTFCCPAIFKTRLKRRAHPKRGSVSVQTFLSKASSSLNSALFLSFSPVYSRSCIGRRMYGLVWSPWSCQVVPESTQNCPQQRGCFGNGRSCSAGDWTSGRGVWHIPSRYILSLGMVLCITYSGLSLIRTPWDQSVFRLVKDMNMIMNVVDSYEFKASIIRKKESTDECAKQCFLAAWPPMPLQVLCLSQTMLFNGWKTMRVH